MNKTKSQFKISITLCHQRLYVKFTKFPKQSLGNKKITKPQKRRHTLHDIV